MIKKKAKNVVCEQPLGVVVEALPNSGEQVSILIGFVVPGVGTSATGYLIATRAN